MSKKGWIKGSLTVEAAFITPIFLLVIFAVLYLFLFVYHHAWYTASAYESVVTAVTEGTKQDGNAGDVLNSKIQSIEMLDHAGCSITVSKHTSSRQVQLNFSGEMPWAYGNRCMQFTAQGECNVIKPVTHIRKIRSAEQLWNMGKGFVGYE